MAVIGSILINGAGNADSLFVDVVSQKNKF